MLQYDPLSYRYPSRRTVLFARRGMTCSTSPIVSGVGLDMLKAGGNAVDAALAMAALIPLAEPTSNGLGSDCFALIWYHGKLYGLNGSGIAPQGLSAKTVRSLGYEKMPRDGWLPVMVPGAPRAWAELRRRFGTAPFSDIFAPALAYARDGYAVPVNPARGWDDAIRRYRAAQKCLPGVFDEWFRVFTKDGAPYTAGDLFRWPEYADALESLAASDCESFYTGELMRATVAESAKRGGYLTAADLAAYRPLWQEPISVRYRDLTVYEMPPNGHGITALMALNILSGLEMPKEREDPLTYHYMIEAVKLAFADVLTYVADPAYMRVSTEQLLSPAYAASRRALIGETALLPEAGDPACGGTVYFCTADGEGNMVSFIQSNYNGFGSGVVVPGTGISLQNRGANFSLDEQSPNVLAGGKRAYHTIIPGFLARNGTPVGPFGVMGAFLQPQGHVQVVVNMADYGMNPQECLDAPRFLWTGGRNVQLEKEVSAGIGAALEKRGHLITVPGSNYAMGRGQIITRLPNGTLAGGTEPRADGSIAIW